MTVKKLVVTCLLLAVILTACSQPTQTPQPAQSTQPADEAYPAPEQAGDAPAAAQPYPEPDSNAVSATPDPAGQILNSAYPAPGDPGWSDYAPRVDDSKMKRSVAFPELASSELLQAESEPPQISLHLIGTLPSPCNQLRVKIIPDEEQMRVDLEVYSVVEAGKACATVLQPFDVTIPLGAFTDGKYTVYVNGEKVGDFDY